MFHTDLIAALGAIGKSGNVVVAYLDGNRYVLTKVSAADGETRLELQRAAMQGHDDAPCCSVPDT